MRNRACRLVTALALLLPCAPARAGGPNTVGAGGNVLKWNPEKAGTFPVKFSIDRGPLGALSNEQGAELVRGAFQEWVSLPTSSIAFEDLGLLEQDLTAANYRAFFEGQVRPENPIVFDDDGRITDDVLGSGSSALVLGFAGVRQADTDGYVSAWAVLNGERSQHPAFRQVIIHEAGHFIGLDHTQANDALAFNGTTLDDRFVPLMYPFILTSGPGRPIRDDIAWVSWLYPESSFSSAPGTIRGRVRRRSGGGFQGANVVAVQVQRQEDGTLQESQEEVVSVVSDFLITGDGSYEIPGLSPGDYAVFIEPLNSLFTSGSGVGPFETRFTDFEKDYYNGAGESGSASDDPAEKVVIRVAAGQRVEGIDLIANEETRQLSSLGDDDETVFDFPAGFTFPFYGETYHSATVNSDGNLTFGRGDPASSPRNEERFLSGPPRIAGLFTDLNPEDGGSVSARVEEDRITFRWDQVPEFEGARTPANTFSITLFSNGDILIEHASFDVTVDVDSGGEVIDPTLAVVGISPGGLFSGDGTDLSSRGDTIEVDGAVYEVFLDGGAFDLEQRRVLFQTQGTPLLFPFYRGDAQTFSGYAVTNLAAQETTLQIEARENSGLLQAFPDNPRPRTVAAGSQLAALGTELFGLEIGVPQRGWVRMRSTGSQVAGFFQFGNGLAGPITRMDGSAAFTGSSQVLTFTRVHDGPLAFPTWGESSRDSVTRLSIANPHLEPVTLELVLYSPGGEALARASRDLEPLGSLDETVRSLFELSDAVGEGHVEVVVEGPGATGFALVELEDTLLGFNAFPAGGSSLLYSAQMAHGRVEGSAIFTDVKLVNPTAQNRSVTVRAFDGEGGELGASDTLEVPAHGSLRRSVGDLIGTGSPVEAALVTGSLRIEADGPGVVGDVVFGDPGGSVQGTPGKVDFAAALALCGQPFTRAVFSQVANVSSSSDPSMNTFTGLALLNPGGQTARVTLEVHDRSGTLVAGTTLELGPRQRRSDTVENLMPRTAGLVRGYIVVESDQPLVAQQLFGNLTLQFLSAVPPRVIQ